MAEEYLVKVDQNTASEVTNWLGSSNAPDWVRFGVREPLSVYGYEPGVEVMLHRINEQGGLLGAEGREDIPRIFVPWANVAYMCDGTSLAKSRNK